MRLWYRKLPVLSVVRESLSFIIHFFVLFGKRGDHGYCPTQNGGKASFGTVSQEPEEKAQDPPKSEGGHGNSLNAGKNPWKPDFICKIYTKTKRKFLQN